MSDASRPELALRTWVRWHNAMVRCLTNAQMATVGSGFSPTEQQLLRFVQGPVSLRAFGGGPSGFKFDLEQRLIVVESGVRRWRVEPRLYEFRLLDHVERELLVYHWQPGPEARGPDHPHLHVSAALRAQTNATTTQFYDLDKRHLPTGPVSLASVVRMLIEEFDVAPLRADWRQRLEQAEQAAGSV